jgi:beta-lactamase superfamily II metal-dependent hydrolase
LCVTGCPDTELPGGGLAGTAVCSGEFIEAFRGASQAERRDDLWIAFVDVGQGDAIWIRTPGERNAAAHEILVDAGDNGTFGRSDGGAALIDFMTENEWPPGSPIHALIVTNPDQDHYGGAQALLFGQRGYDVSLYADPGRSSDSEGYMRFIGDVEGKPGLEVLRPARTLLPARLPGLSDGQVVFTLLASDENAPTENGASIVLRVDYAGRRVLLTGDAEAETLEALAVARPADLKANVLKVSHHGSKNNSPRTFVDAVFPLATASSLDRYAIVPVGPGNTYGHPEPGVLESLALAVGLRGLYRTDRGDAGKGLAEGPGDDHVLLRITPDGQLTVCYAYPDAPAPAAPSGAP